MAPAAVQATLFGRAEPRIDPGFTGVRRIRLSGEAWLDHLPGWIEGHESLFDLLWATTRWQSHRRHMYDRVVDVPRLVADLPDDGPGHPVLAEAAEALSRRYGLRLDQVSLAAYRDGRDSVAFHGDRMGRLIADTVVAIVSVGAPRRFLIRPRGGGPSRAFDLGWGDLLAMGGSCQRDWEHAVPKMAVAAPRISIQFRVDTTDAGP
jgi:alkylated DNA repair dioxygenase AlkB